jgi:vacuolar-type H+-ATPase subunit C/Vma6
VENELDKTYYHTLLHAINPTTEPKRAFLNFVRLEADFLELKTVLRLRAAGLEDATPYLVDPEGEMNPGSAARLLRAPPEEFVHEVEGMSFRAIARGKQAGLTEEEIENLLVVI